MIIERNEFKLKFGKAKEAIAIWKEIMESGKKEGMKVPEIRLLTDISGPSYLLIVEIQMGSFTDLNQKNTVWVTTEVFRGLYEKFIPLCESANREYFTVEHSV